MQPLVPVAKVLADAVRDAGAACRPVYGPHVLHPFERLADHVDTRTRFDPVDVVEREAHLDRLLDPSAGVPTKRPVTDSAHRAHAPPSSVSAASAGSSARVSAFLRFQVAP